MRGAERARGGGRSGCSSRSVATGLVLELPVWQVCTVRDGQGPANTRASLSARTRCGPRASSRDRLRPGAVLASSGARCAPGVELAYVREGVGGFPLLLVHGWPETMRIWWRNVEPLAEAGFEVIVPDLRGFGASGLAPDGYYDMAAQRARPPRARPRRPRPRRAAPPRAATTAASSIQDLGLRFEGFVVRQCLFNTILPLLAEEYAAAGPRPRAAARGPDGGRLLRPPGLRGRRAGRGARHAGEAPALHRDVLRPRFWASPGTFTPRRRRLHDRAVRGRRQAARRRSATYESAHGQRPALRAAALPRDATPSRRSCSTAPTTT